MRVLINGKPRDLAHPLRISDLIAELGLGEKRLAVEVNGEILPRSRHAQTSLREGDRLEIVQAIGGG
ncbi:MAG: sulfur carrier protein ThiS [Nevskiales bacterium]